MDDDKKHELDKQIEAREHFFKSEKIIEFEDKLKNLPKIELDDIEDIKHKIDEDTVQDKDSISYYNRKYKDKAITKTIPGSFYKVRAQGGASKNDNLLID